MKRIAIIIALLSVTFSYGQTVTDSISMKKAFGNTLFYQGGTRLNMKQLVYAMEPNKEAYFQIKTAQSTYTVVSIIEFAGGFMIGWPLGMAMAGKDPDWTMAGIGAGLVVVSIPIRQKFNKQANLAIDTYNGGNQSISFWDKSELRLSMTGNGIGFTLRF